MCPLVYEVAVYISNKIEQYYATQINENEIAYIALHVGSQIDAINSLNTKINCVLICPDFYSLKEKLYTAIHARYQESLMITNILSNVDSSFDYSACDLIITTVSLPQAFEPKAIMVNYILSQDDYIRLDQVIAKNLMHKNSLKLYNSISFLSKQLVSRNIVPASFTEECLQREKITPTNFEALAIPHPVALTAYHSAIAVAVNKKYFNWNNKKIKMILMLAIKPDDIALFKPIFELISYYSNGMLNLDKVLKADTFEDFKAQIRQIGKTNEIS